MSKVFIQEDQLIYCIRQAETTCTLSLGFDGPVLGRLPPERDEIRVDRPLSSFVNDFCDVDGRLNSLGL
jgi:hypothetical protein